MSDTLAVGRIGWWRFQNGSLLDESGNGNHATITGNCYFTNDKDGIENNAITKNNAVLGSVFLGNTNLISGRSKFTLNLFIERQTLQGYNTEELISFDDYRAVTTFTDGTGLRVYDPSGSGIFKKYNVRNVWQMWTFEYNNGALNWYIDNALFGNCDITFNNFTYPIRLLVAQFSSNIMDEISFYDRVLTVDEKAELLARGVNYNSDTTPPSFNSVNIDMISYTTANLNANANENSTVYYKVLARNTTAPTSAELKASHDGTIALISNITSIQPITSLIANTQYDLYVVAEDTAGNLQDTPTKIQFQTLAVPKVATPIANIPSGTYETGKTIILSSATAGATIRYTLDGTEPTGLSQLYSNPIVVSESTAIKAKAYKIGYIDSDIASFIYTIAPSDKEKRALMNFNKIFRSDQYLIDLCNSIGIELNAVEELMQKIYANMFFDTMDEELGIPAIAKNLQLTFPDNSTIAEKRNMIQAKWKSKGKCSEELLQSIANSWKNGEITVKFENDIIKVTFANSAGVPEGIDNLKQAFDEVKPAYLLVEYLFNWLNWNLKDSWDLNWNYWDNLNLSWDDLEKTIIKP